MNMKAVAQNVGFVLEHNRLAYRSFGPWWWAVKDTLIDQGLGDALGLRPHETDPRLARWYDHNSSEQLVREGLKVHSEAASSGRLVDNVGQTPDGERYIIHDSDME